MDAILEYLAKKLSEPSTYVSLGVLTTAIGWKISPQYWDTISMFCMGLGGFIGIILSERKKTTAGEIKNVVEAVVKTTALEPQKPTAPELNTAMNKTPTP